MVKCRLDPFSSFSPSILSAARSGAIRTLFFPVGVIPLNKITNVFIFLFITPNAFLNWRCGASAEHRSGAEKRYGSSFSTLSNTLFTRERYKSLPDIIRLPRSKHNLFCLLRLSSMNQLEIQIKECGNPIVDHTMDPHFAVRERAHHFNKFSQMKNIRCIEGNRNMYICHV